MKYYLKNGIVIDSSRTAKSYKQPAKAVLDYISKINTKQNILDYGCGKLRYSVLLAQNCHEITLVDSVEQLSKIQTVHDKKTSVYNYIKSELDNARVLTIEEFDVDKCKYDFVMCSNVLSAIPCEETRSKVLNKIRLRIIEDGKALFVTQYTNSFYSRKKDSKLSAEYMDGWLTVKNKSGTYYGLINRTNLVKLLKEHKYKVIKSWTEGQSAFALVTR